ncbi:MAG: ABC transporter permease subunit, partial [Verrucomicrobiae bacterium]|nr:ABC transporter permease subunit [Verrucomicrobiae bacterium]
MNNFAVPAVLQVKVLPVEVYVLANTTLDYMGALVMSWPLVLGPLLLLAVLRAKQINWSWRTAETCPAVWKRSVGRTWFAICGMACGIVGILSVIVPVAEPIRNADTWRVINSTWLASSEVVVRSACVAAIGGLLILLVGSLLSRISGGFFSWVLFLIPGVVFGIVLIEAFNRPPFLVLYRSVAVMFVALVLRYAAVGRTGVLAAKSAVDRNLVDAARLDGATAWQTFKHASWPQMKASLAVTWYVAYLLCLWDVETILFVVPPGAETLPLRIFNLLHYGHNPEINALCLMMLVLAVLPLFVWVTLHWPGQRPRSSVANREQNLAAGRRANTTCRAAGTALIALGLLTGCSRETPSRADLRSRLFSHVEIIGSRGTAPGQFNKPRSLTVDGQDNLYVADMTGRIQKFAPDGTWLLSWMMPETDLGKPKGMGIDKDGYVIVVEPHYSRINHFNSHGVLVRQWGQHGTNAGQLVFPRAVAVNKAGDIFVSEYGRVDRIQRFSSDGTRLLGVIGAYGYGPGQLNRPEGLAIDKEERLYVA